MSREKGTRMMRTLDAHFLREGTCRWICARTDGRIVVGGSSGGHALDVLYMYVVWIWGGALGPVQPAAGTRSERGCVYVLMFTLRQARHRSATKCRRVRVQVSKTTRQWLGRGQLSCALTGWDMRGTGKASTTEYRRKES